MDPLVLLLVDQANVHACLTSQGAGLPASARIIHATDVDAATRIIAREHVDLLAVDPMLPGGFELIRQVKAENRWPAAMVITENQSPDFLQLAVQCRIDGLLFKPVSPATLLERALFLAGESRDRRRRQQKRVLAIGAHPDDVELGCGGTLAKHHSSGDLLHILTLSRGGAGGDVNVRMVEAQQAAKLLGATLEFGDLPDAYIPHGAETISVIQAAIRELKATHVYTHSLEDTHQDHRAVNIASMVAARGVSNVYCYQSPSSTVEFSPNHFVDITDHMAFKLGLIQVYKSQVSRSTMLQDDVTVAAARYWGRFAGHVMAEPMKIVRQCDGGTNRDVDKQCASVGLN